MFCYVTFAQKVQELIPTGTWRTHLTYHNARSLALTEDRIYASSENGLFYLDRATKELFILSKLDGLSDNQFSKIAYHKTLKKLLITYRNGNIDILTENNGRRAIVNIDDIFKSNQLSNKQINHITLHENLAYLSMASGVVVIDLARNKIFENYLQLGNNASTLQTYSSTIAKDSIFLATDIGVLVASLSSQINRQDPRNWQRANLRTVNRVRALATKNNKIYYTDDGLGIFEYDNGRSTAFTIPQAVARNFFNIVASADKQNIVVCAAGLLITIDNQNVVKTFSQRDIVFPQEADIENNVIWVADSGNGILNNATGQFSPAYPRGTYNAASFDLLYFQDKILAVSGGYNSFLQAENRRLGFYIFEKGEWTNYNTNRILAGIIQIPDTRNVVQACYDESSKKVYLATYTDGLLVLDLATNTVTPFNTPALPSQRITALTIDKRGALWITIAQPTANAPFLYKLENNAWKPFALAEVNNSVGETPLQIFADEGNNIWLRMRNINTQDFLAVVNERGQQKVLRSFGGEFQYAGTEITCVELDKEGNLWIGGNKGIRVLSNAASVISRNNVELAPVRFEQRQLFRDEAVTALKTDGGNRKWIATAQGVWLFSANGAEQILQFSTQNSPLLANNIRAITIHEKTGEVFFATSEGIVSYRADATTAQENFDSIKIFPNPVPQNFQGFVTIEGLADNSNVKITDISGRLIHETQSQGGTAVWRGTDYTGRRAATGIYLVFSTNATGEQSIVGKIAVIE